MEVKKDRRGMSGGAKTNICFDCQKACGGCSWSEIDPNTKKPRFEPVPGWTAEKVLLNLGMPKNGSRFMETYHITACPLFEPDEPRKTDGRMMTPEQSDYFLKNLFRVLRRWEDG